MRGRGAADVIVERFGALLERVVIFGGRGQNGGDAWVVARQLQSRGHTPQVIAFGSSGKQQGDVAINWAALQGLGIPCTSVRIIITEVRNHNSETIRVHRAV